MPTVRFFKEPEEVKFLPWKQVVKEAADLFKKNCNNAITQQNPSKANGLKNA